MKDLKDLEYVSFNVARLFESELGYDEESLVVYKYDNFHPDENHELVCMGSPKKNLHLKKYSTVAALTLQEALEYIREKYHYHIQCFASENNRDGAPQNEIIWEGVWYKIPSNHGLIRGVGHNYESAVDNSISLFIQKIVNDYKY